MNRRSRMIWHCFLRMAIVVAFFVATFVTENRLDAQSISEINRFRIDNVVRMEKDDARIEVKTTTIFCDGTIFDFIGDNGEIIIYRNEDEVFHIVDPIRRIQTSLTKSDVEGYINGIVVRLREKDDKFCNFMLTPAFDFSKLDESGELFFQSKWIDYKIKTRAFDDPACADDYFQFIDAYSPLNIYLNPGAVASFARLSVNEYLKREKCFPEKISTTIFPKGKLFFGKTINIESEHKLIRRLNEEDQGRVIRALHFEKQFPRTTVGEYHKKTGEK